MMSLWEAVTAEHEAAQDVERALVAANVQPERRAAIRKAIKDYRVAILRRQGIELRHAITERIP